MLKNNIYKELEKRVLVKDGATGSLIQEFRLSEEDYRGERLKDFPHELKGNNDILSLTQPLVVEDIHRRYLDAGADIILTNTFNATSISQADYHTEALVYEMNVAAASLASRIAGEYTRKNKEKPRFVAGSLGPTNKTLSLSPDVNDPGYRSVTFDEVKNSYRTQVEGLLDGGIDLILIETVFDTLNGKAAILAVEEAQEKRGIHIPLMVSGTITDASGRTLSGQTLEAFLISVSHADLLSIGLNCSLGAADLLPYIKELAGIAPFYISCHPNAGLPNQFGGYDETPGIMSAYIQEYLDNQYVNIIGGCCGTTPDHIREFAKLAGKAIPHKKKIPDRVTRLSGLEPLTVFAGSNFVNIGERCNVAGSRRFARLIREQKYGEALAIARNQVENGAQVIDVSMDDAMLDAQKEMIRFLHLLMAEPDIARVPLMIDSSKWEVIEAGLKCSQGKAIVNSISLKEGEAVFLHQARQIKRYGAAVVVMAFDETGQADNLARRIEIAERAYKLLVEKVGFPPQDILFDTNVLAIGTGIEAHNSYAVDFMDSVRWIKEHLPHAKTSGGISNVSFSFRGNNTVREAIHSVFLYHAIRAGLDMGIVNPGMLQIYDEIPKDLLEKVEDLVLNRRPDATDRLLNFAQDLESQNPREIKKEVWREQPLEERISHSLVKGIPDFVDEDMAEAVKTISPALDIIEGPLMNGMNTVGDLFGTGKMFLPQVIKSARVMKKAVAFLLPYIEADKEKQTLADKQKKVLLATVKGDVHDIGKNIAGVVLGCNNYNIIDLGVMVPTDKILDTAVKEKVDVIGLSGLITPSLEIMVEIAREMKQRKLTIPLLIGGATTSKIHTAVKIDPEYNHTVIHVSDASQAVKVVANLFSGKKEYRDSVKKEYAELRTFREKQKPKVYVSPEEARKNKWQINWTKDSVYKPNFTGVKKLINFSLEELREYIDWTFFFIAWDMNGSYPRILNDPEKGEEARKLYADANEMLDEIHTKHMLQANGVLGLWPAHSEGDDIVLFEDAQKAREVGRFHHLRQEEKKKEGPNLCLADFIAPAETGIVDFCGAFATTAGIGIEPWKEKFLSEKNDYKAIMLEVLADRLSEAFAERLHEIVRKTFWGYAPEEKLSKEELLKGKYQGIRPAPGYPACPEHSEKENLFKLLGAGDVGMSLTEHYAMYPNASVCGTYFAHPGSHYFGLGKISKQQVREYARRKGVSIEFVEKFLPSNRIYK
jgi:5-methyltetrahydrofolate--homocysteine methyltransferase